MKTIVAFAGSNSSTSINKELVKFTLTYFPNYHIKFLDINDYEGPLFSVDREKQIENFDAAIRFINEFKDIDGIICSLAEHNGNYTAAFKNLMDWCSRKERSFFNQKPCLLLSTSPGRYGGAHALETGKILLEKLGCNITDTFSLPSFGHNFINNDIIDLHLKEDLENKIDVFKEAI